MSLRLRLALAGALAILVALGLAGVGLAQLFGAHVERRAIAEMEVLLDQVIAGLEPGEVGPTVMRPPTDPRFDRPYSGYYWQITGDWGAERARSLWDQELALPMDTLDDAAVHLHRLSGPQGAELLVLERSVRLADRLGGGQARVAVAMDRAELEAARHAFLANLLPYLLLLGLILTAAGWIQLWVGLSPLGKLGARLKALRAGQTHRMGADWPREVRPVATEIDALLAAREEQIERAKSRAADLAHGLKTPLQALMGEATRLRELGAVAQAEAIEDTGRVMQRTIDRELARARTAAREDGASADAAIVAKGVRDVLRRTPDGNRLTWHLAIDPGLLVALHDGDLAEALGALAENAARHAVSKVSFTAKRQRGYILLCVTDDGPGIPEAQREALTQRHARADENGTGLGLAIASDIAQASGGALVLENAKPGLRAILRLPVARLRSNNQMSGGKDGESGA